MNKLCTNCGNPISGSEKFCTKCGQKTDVISSNAEKHITQENHEDLFDLKDKSGVNVHSNKETINQKHIRQYEKMNNRRENIIYIARIIILFVLTVGIFITYEETKKFWPHSKINSAEIISNSTAYYYGTQSVVHDNEINFYLYFLYLDNDDKYSLKVFDVNKKCFLVNILNSYKQNFNLINMAGQNINIAGYNAGILDYGNEIHLMIGENNIIVLRRVPERYYFEYLDTCTDM